MKRLREEDPVGLDSIPTLWLLSPSCDTSQHAPDAPYIMVRYSSCQHSPSYSAAPTITASISYCTLVSWIHGSHTIYLLQLKPQPRERAG
jgi:hypothetical protein